MTPRCDTEAAGLPRFRPIVYAGTHDGFFRAPPDGPWERMDHGLRSTNVLSLVLDPAAPSTLYAGTASGIYRSVDGAQAWTLLAADAYAIAMAIDPSSPSVLYAGTQLGVIKSRNAGAQWSALHLWPKPEGSGADRLLPSPATPRRRG